MLRLNPYAAAFSKEKLGQKPVESEKPAHPSKEFMNTLREE
jgi:large subunit ribosomal protein L4e